MVQKEAVLTDKAPLPLPIFSQAIKCGPMVYCSGSVGMNPTTNTLIEGEVGARAEQCLKNLSVILEEAGSSLDKVVKVNIFLTNMESFAPVNMVYEKYFNKEPKPVRLHTISQGFCYGMCVDSTTVPHLRSCVSVAAKHRC